LSNLAFSRSAWDIAVDTAFLYRVGGIYRSRVLKSSDHPGSRQGTNRKTANRKTMGSTTIDGASPAQAGPGTVIHLSFRGSNGRVTTRVRSGR
jgi:hypothetical protein